MEKPNLILYGRVIALSGVTEIPSKDAGKPAMKKRELYLDCTRYDSLTREQVGSENKPLLEFGGEKVLEKLAALNLQKDDVVAVRFAIQGTPFKDQKTGKMRVFTAIRCYDIEVVRKAGQQAQPAAQQQQQPVVPPVAQPLVQSTQAEPVSQQGGDDGLPF